MRMVYVLLSPTPGMHQYTADLANRMADNHEVHLVTTERWPVDRYDPRVRAHAVCRARNTGLATHSLQLGEQRRVGELLTGLKADLVHFTGPHIWNTFLLGRLRRTGTPTLHTIHDLDPHSGAGYGRLLSVWNRVVIGRADHVLVHGDVFRRRLIGRGIDPVRVSAWPIMHLFAGFERQETMASASAAATYERFVLFFGRLERYKGLDLLLAAFEQLAGHSELDGWRLVAAGSGRSPARPESLPEYFEWREGYVDDAGAVRLFQRCGVVALPYRDASQSALIPAAYYFRKPVIASTAGALPEYVDHGRTGLLVTPGRVDELAAAIKSFIRDPGLGESMGRSARKWYDSERIQETRALHDLYASLAG